MFTELIPGSPVRCQLTDIALACARASARLLDNILIDNEMSECDNFTLPQTMPEGFWLLCSKCTVVLCATKC